MHLEKTLMDHRKPKDQKAVSRVFWAAFLCCFGLFLFLGGFWGFSTHRGCGFAARIFPVSRRKREGAERSSQRSQCIPSVALNGTAHVVEGHLRTQKSARSKLPSDTPCHSRKSARGSRRFCGFVCFDILYSESASLVWYSRWWNRRIVYRLHDLVCRACSIPKYGHEF